MPVTDAIRVLLVDDHEVVRQGLRNFLGLQPGIEVVGEAGDGAGIAVLVRETRADVVLMDLVMPGVDGIEAIRELRRDSPGTRVLVLSTFADDAQVFAAVQAGAAGYVLKDIRPDDLADAVRQVHAGRSVLHPDAAARLMERTQDPGAAFTGRERDVLKLLTEGLANKEIARRLLISEKTVKTHVSNILQKLGVQDRTQAAVLAVRQRLVD
jgi:NarL family two-component system response regulator LiaR